MPQTKTKPPARECRHCAQPRYAQVLAAIEQGLPLSRAAAAVPNLYRENVYRHRAECPTFRKRLDRARMKNARSVSEDGRRPIARLSRQGQQITTAVAIAHAQPSIVAAIVAGLSLPAAARAAGVNVNTAQSWYRRRPDFRAAVDAAQSQAETP